MNLGNSPIGRSSVADDQAARDQERRRQRETVAMRSGWPELRRADLILARFVVVHEPTGDQYRVYRGEISTGPAHPCSAWFFAQDGSVEFLEAVNAKARV